jgi:hypothetical protein
MFIASNFQFPIFIQALHLRPCPMHHVTQIRPLELRLELPDDHITHLQLAFFGL